LTFEDFFMADLAMAPLKIVGFEGVFGSIMMIFVLLPAAYFLPGPEGLGLHENTLDTLEMIKNSRGLKVRAAAAAAAAGAVSGCPVAADSARSPFPCIRLLALCLAPQLTGCCCYCCCCCRRCASKVVLGVDMFALLAYNMSGMMVTDHLGAVFRTVLETMRTLFVWLLGLLLFYTPLGMGTLGESWTSWSFLQAAG
jgi:hypothetical protein